MPAGITPLDPRSSVPLQPGGAAQPSSAPTSSWCCSSCCSAAPGRQSCTDSCLCRILAWICTPVTFLLRCIVSCVSCVLSYFQNRPIAFPPEWKKAEGESISIPVFLDTWDRVPAGDSRSDLLLWQNQLPRLMRELKPDFVCAIVEAHYQKNANRLPSKPSYNLSEWGVAVLRDLCACPYSVTLLEMVRPANRQVQRAGPQVLPSNKEIQEAWTSYLARQKQDVLDRMLEEYSRHPWNPDLPTKPQEGDLTAWRKAVLEDLEKYPGEERVKAVERVAQIRAREAPAIKLQATIVKSFREKWEDKIVLNGMQEWEADLRKLPQIILERASKKNGVACAVIEKSPGNADVLQCVRDWLRASEKYIEQI